MVSTTKRGNYYKNKTRDWYKKRGYFVQITEFTTIRFIGKNKTIYAKVDVLGSDGIALNGKEIIFWNSKHCATNDEHNIQVQFRQAELEFAKYPFPKFVKRCAVMWLPRINKPIVKYFK